MATASLTGMPLELLVHLIATYLSTHDLSALRLTNKYLEKALFDTFAKEFFTKRQFMLTTSSLQALVDISKHGAFNKTLKHVIIGLEYYQPSIGVFHRTMSDAQKEAWRKGHVDQFALTSCGRDREMLADALRGLPNLETLGIHDYQASGSPRDGGCWRSYGALTVYRETGFILETESSSFVSRTFLLLIQALADADRTVSCIETILRKPHVGLGDFAFFLNSSNNGTDLVLAGLERLLLTLDLDQGPINRIGRYEHSFLMIPFLLKTSSLVHLRLNFQRHNRLIASRVLAQLNTTANQLSNLLPILQRLDLGMICIKPDALVQVTTRFSATLLHLGIWKVELLYDGAVHWKDSKARYSPWPRVLLDLSATTTLAGMTIGCLSQITENHIVVRTSFSDGKVSRECSGDMKVWLSQLVDDIKVAWPQNPTGDDSGSEDDESEHGDGDDDADIDNDDD